MFLLWFKKKKDITLQAEINQTKKQRNYGNEKNNKSRNTQVKNS